MRCVIGQVFFKELIAANIEDLKINKELGFGLLISSESAESDRILLDAGADVNYIDTFKNSVWEYALPKNAEYVKAIVKSGKCKIHKLQDFHNVKFNYERDALMTMKAIRHFCILKADMWMISRKHMEQI